MPQVFEQIDHMSTAERVQTMEYLWSVLSSHYNVETPSWHADVLASRADAPDEAFQDWESAKRELRREVIAR